MTEIKWSAREYLIAFFCLFITLPILLWQIPNQSWLGEHLVTPAVAKILRSYMIPLGLNQEWKMFAPNPANIIIYPQLRLEYADGEGRIELPEDVPKWVGRTVNGLPKTVILTPDFNANGYRATAFSKLDWNFSNGVLPHFRQAYLRYFCTHRLSSRLPTSVYLDVGRVTIPTLAEARAGAQDPRTINPPKVTEASVTCQ